MRSLLLKAWLTLAMAAGTATTVLAADGDAAAQKTIGAAYAGQLGLPVPASTIKEDVNKFHDLLEIVIFAITAFVFLLLAIVIVRFRRKANPVASTRTHNTPLEVLWTIIPVLILVVLAFPSTKLLYYMDKAKNPELTVKITGHQWYWGYEFPDQKVKFSPDTEVAIDEWPSNILRNKKGDVATNADLKPGQLRLLSVDQPLVVPVDTEIQFLVTGADVIHSWYVPSIGINRAAVPGRTNEAWAKITQEGVFYGQCSKICGLNHGYMPIEIRAVSKEKFLAWAAAAKTDGVDKANASVLGLNTASNDNSAGSGKPVSLASQQ